MRQTGPLQAVLSHVTNRITTLRYRRSPLNAALQNGHEICSDFIREWLVAHEAGILTTAAQRNDFVAEWNAQQSAEAQSAVAVAVSEPGTAETVSFVI